jgi:hypothetical protein
VPTALSTPLSLHLQSFRALAHATSKLKVPRLCIDGDVTHRRATALKAPHAIPNHARDGRRCRLDAAKGLLCNVVADGSMSTGNGQNKYDKVSRRPALLLIPRRVTSIAESLRA